MRHRLFLAVLLSLVLGLLKETTAATGGEDPKTSTTVPTTSETPGSGDETVTTASTTSKDTGSDDETVTTPAPKANTTSNNTGSGNETVITPAPTANTTSNNTGSGNETVTTPAPTANTTSNNTGSGNETVTTPTPTVNTTSKPPEDFCSTEPCGRNFAKCVPLKSNYTCQCDFGFYYNKDEKNCYKGDVFPGSINVNVSYSSNLQVVNSTEYEELFNNVSEFFRKALTNLSGYAETVIVKIEPQKKKIGADPGINVTVINLFQENSNQTNKTVAEAVARATNGTQSYVTSYSVAKKCDVFECDTRTTECVEGPVPECKCKSDLEKTEWDDRSCSVCSESCSAKEKKYCTIENGTPTCKCMANFKYKDQKCIACPVGYSGDNCTDNTELILIIVGTIFGAIILSLVIAVSVISARTKHNQNPEKKRLIKSGYSDTSVSDDRPTMMFPRVQTTSGHSNPGYQPNNPYEMRSTNRGHFSERGFDDLYEPSRERAGFRMQSRY